MDRRDQSHQWYTSFHEDRMVLVLEGAGPDNEDLEIPAVFAVCETCDGRGQHVNPGVDAHGLTAEDFADDPDFADDYRSGAYDVPCAECGGRRVMPVIAPDAPAALRQLAENWQRDYYAALAEYAAERRMGA